MKYNTIKLVEIEKAEDVDDDNVDAVDVAVTAFDVVIYVCYDTLWKMIIIVSSNDSVENIL